MSVPLDSLEQFPQQIQMQRSMVYVRQSNYFAVHLQQPSQSQENSARLAAEAVLTLEENIAIFRGSPATHRSIAAQAISAVYALEPGGSIAVPTGQVFLRFAEGVSVETQQNTIQQAGYQVTEIIFYAPNAAWLRPLSGEIADALRLLPRLEAIDPVAVVEPQMVMGRSKRELGGSWGGVGSRE